MRVDTKKPDVKTVASVGVAILIILLFSNLSLAGVADVIREELDEHDILESLGGTVTDGGKSSKSSKTYYSTDSNSGSGSGTNAVSGSYSEPVVTDLYSLLQRYTQYYNKGIDEVPDVVKKVAGNDVILLNIAMNDKSDLNIKVTTEDGLVTEFCKVSSEENIDPTVTLTSNENAIRAILKSNDPLGYFVDALNQGSVNVECKGLLKKAALSALKALA